MSAATILCTSCAQRAWESARLIALLDDSRCNHGRLPPPLSRAHPSPRRRFNSICRLPHPPPRLLPYADSRAAPSGRKSRPRIRTMAAPHARRASAPYGGSLGPSTRVSSVDPSRMRRTLTKGVLVGFQPSTVSALVGSPSSTSTCPRETWTRRLTGEAGPKRAAAHACNGTHRARLSHSRAEGRALRSPGGDLFFARRGMQSGSAGSIGSIARARWFYCT